MHKASDILDDLAPILAGRFDFKDWSDAILSTSHAEIVRAQNAALPHVWDAYAALAQQSGSKHPIVPKKLSRLFMDTGRYIGVAQLQRPVIVSNKNVVTVGLEKTLRGKKRSRYQISLYNVIGSRTPISYHQDKIAHYGFTFVNVTDKELGKITTFPIVILEDRVMHETLYSGAYALLQDLQRIIEVTNHDYNHAVTAARTTPYFSTDGFRLEYTDYGTVHAGRDLKADDKAPQNIGAIYGSPHLPNVANYGADALQRYEVHLTHAHAQLYMKKLHRSSVGKDLKKHLYDFFESLRFSGLSPESKIYYTALLHHRLLFMVPSGHEILNYVEYDAMHMNIDPDIVKRTLRPEECITPQVLRQCKLTEKAATSGRLGEALRLRSHALAPDFWDVVHYADSAKAKKTAIPDLSIVYAAAWNDMAIVRNHMTATTPKAKARFAEAKALRKLRLTA